MRFVYYLFVIFFIGWTPRLFGESDDNNINNSEIVEESVYFEDDVFSPWEGGPSYYSQWANGPSSASDFFPIVVWLQNPSSANVTGYKNIGINTYIDLHNVPTENQLIGVSNNSIIAFCDQNSTGLNSTNNSVVKAWTHIDEPDNAVFGTQVPVPTSIIIDHYNTMRNNDNTRPVYLNLEQGVACDTWYGRGNRTNHPEDYAEYSKGADIVSFDVYPMNAYPPLDTEASWKEAFNNKLNQKPWFVANGVKRLRQWTNYSKPVWTWIECTNLRSNPSYCLTPKIVKTEVWMALINGARGIGYFCHQLSPFIEAGLLANSEMSDGVSAINNEIISCAEILNTQSVTNSCNVVSDNTEVIIDAMLKRVEGYTYVFAVASPPGTTEATFSLTNFFGNKTIEVVGENRNLTPFDGIFKDTFSDSDVHIYKVNHSKTSMSMIDSNSFGYNSIVYTNPFNDRIKFKLSSLNLVQPELRIFDINGQVLYKKSIVEEELFCWSGKDLSDREVPPGMYFYRINSLRPTTVLTGEIVKIN